MLKCLRQIGIVNSTREYAPKGTNIGNGLFQVDCLLRREQFGVPLFQGRHCIRVQLGHLPEVLHKFLGGKVLMLQAEQNVVLKIVLKSKQINQNL